MMNMANPLAFFGLWRGIIGTALAIAMIYLLFKLAQVADAYKGKIQRENAARDPKAE